MKPPLRTLRMFVLVASAVLASGCERALLAFVNRGVPAADASAAYASRRGLWLDVFGPVGAPAAAPTVVFFHGGAWKRGQRDQYRFVGHRLARNGVLAIVADYRTYPAAGFPAFMHDAADAVVWARAHATQYGGDPDRLFVMGHSAGAQIAGLLGTDATYLAARGIAPSALAGVIGLSGPYDFAVGPKYAAIFGPAAQWPRAQAVNFVGGGEPPFLLIHGGSDRVVDAADSIELAARLRAAGDAATLLLLPGAGHSAPLAALYEPARSPRVLPAILAFMRAPAAGAGTH